MNARLQGRFRIRFRLVCMNLYFTFFEKKSEILPIWMQRCRARMSQHALTRRHGVSLATSTLFASNHSLPTCCYTVEPATWKQTENLCNHYLRHHNNINPALFPGKPVAPFFPPPPPVFSTLPATSALWFFIPGLFRLSLHVAHKYAHNTTIVLSVFHFLHWNAMNWRRSFSE